MRRRVCHSHGGPSTHLLHYGGWPCAGVPRPDRCSGKTNRGAWRWWVVRQGPTAQGPILPRDWPRPRRGAPEPRLRYIIHCSGAEDDMVSACISDWPYPSHSPRAVRARAVVQCRDLTLYRTDGERARYTRGMMLSRQQPCRARGGMPRRRSGQSDRVPWVR